MRQQDQASFTPASLILYEFSVFSADRSLGGLESRNPLILLIYLV